LDQLGGFYESVEVNEGGLDHDETNEQHGISSEEREGGKGLSESSKEDHGTETKDGSETRSNAPRDAEANDRTNEWEEARNGKAEDETDWGSKSAVKCLWSFGSGFGGLEVFHKTSPLDHENDEGHKEEKGKNGRDNEEDNLSVSLSVVFIVIVIAFTVIIVVIILFLEEHGKGDEIAGQPQEDAHVSGDDSNTR